MTDLLPVLSTLGVGALLAALPPFRTAARQHGLQRRMEVTQSFLEVCAHAHGRPHNDRSQNVGLAEQLAAIKLMLGLANDFKFLRAPAREALEAMDRHFAGVSGNDASREIATAARDAVAAMKPVRRGWGVGP